MGRRIFRVVVPAALIVGWLVCASIGGPYFGRVAEVSSNDATSYLPATADSTRVQQRLPDFLGSDTLPATAVFIDDSTSPARQVLPALERALGRLSDIPGLAGASGPMPSQDGRAAEAFLAVRSSADVQQVISAVRDRLTSDVPPGITVHVTGPAGFQADLAEAFGGIDGLLLGVALAAVLLILIAVYRSVVLPILVLVTSMFALCAALLSVWWLAKFDVLVLTGQTQGILFILVIGAATDYALLYTARFREELLRRRDKGEATRRALRGARGPMIASAGTVAAGLLCLMLSDLNSNRSLGPVGAIGVGFALLAALTLLPSLLFVCGRVAYWPRRPRFQAETADAETPVSGPYAAIARLVARRPWPVWIVIAALLLAGSVGLGQLRADGVAQSDLVLGHSDARDGQKALSRHFAGGSGSPAYLIVKHADLRRAAHIAAQQAGVASVRVASKAAPGGSAPMTSTGIAAVEGRRPQPTVVDGRVLLQATVAAAPDSSAAQQTVQQLRTRLSGIAIIGGATATALDTNTAAIRDRNVIIPVVLLVIMVILMVLLRAVVAPVLLMLTTVLSLAATLGVSALIFNDVLDLPGADPSVPLYGFVFLVALGVDYNIFLMTRVREEAQSYGTRTGIVRGLAVTGGVITSAGLVLAATFAALAVIPILFLLQLAVIVSLGVLLDTFLVRTLLLPALSYVTGARIWWPSSLPRRRMPG